MAPPTSPGDGLIQNVLSEETGQSLFACSHCRRQKVKCSRSLPSCDNCMKASRPCPYPATVHKPGPKAGTHRRARPSAHENGNPVSGGAMPVVKRAKLEDGNSSLSASHPQRHDSGQAQLVAHRDITPWGTTPYNPRATSSRGNSILRLVHPSHDPSHARQPHEELPDDGEEACLMRFSTACHQLNCSIDQGRELIEGYFTHMTSFSLFHRPTFDQKLKSIVHPKQLEAFLSALFSYALRFKNTMVLVKDTDLSATSMLEWSSQLQQECIEDCLDEDPPLHLLQSLYIVTYQKLIQGVRGKTWRMLGDCIRIGYELNLHMVDVERAQGGTNEDEAPRSESWVAAEERRRMWWCLWESDIFTSTIRRLPNAIDERLNFTLLPVPDEDWFTGKETLTCFLVADATLRWKNIVESGNKSPQTWFILVNSYMYDAHKMVLFPEVWASRIGFKISARGTDGRPPNLIPTMHDFVDNCLHCAYMSLPQELNCENRFLAFGVSTATYKPSLRALDNARYSIHVMTQLCRLMLCVWELHRASLSVAHNTDPSARTHLNEEATALEPESYRDNDRRIWNRYLDAANLIAEVVRNSSPQHYQYVNPLIANTIWYAAASLVVAKLLGPPGFDSRLAQSNFDLLVATLNKFEQFWQIPNILKVKLKDLETALDELRQRPPRTDQNPAMNTANTHSASAAASERAATEITQPRRGQQYAYATTPSMAQMSVQNLNINEQDWLSQNYFDFNMIPTVGFGPADAITPLPIDTDFDNSILLAHDGINFNDFFNYPYQ